MWKLHAGDPGDYAYPADIAPEFSRAVNQLVAGDHGMDIVQVFVPR